MLASRLVLQLANRVKTHDLVLLIVVPSYDCFGLVVDFQAFAPLQRCFNLYLIYKLDLDVGAFHVNLRCQLGRVLAIVVKVKYGDAIDSRGYE